MRVALLALILPRVMKKGESKKAALILMKNSFWQDTTVDHTMSIGHKNVKEHV